MSVEAHDRKSHSDWSRKRWRSKYWTSTTKQFLLLWQKHCSAKEQLWNCSFHKRTEQILMELLVHWKHMQPLKPGTTEVLERFLVLCIGNKA